VSAPIQAIRGMNDILPIATPSWRALEDRVRRVFDAYAYEEIRFPIVEHTAVFQRLGAHTDIVEKEMYTFDDRNGDSLTLRPEGTAGCVRSAVENGLLYNQTQRLWYQGPMFRHEKPQQERYRQFHQIGAEAFGMAGPDVDAELICLTARIWRELGLQDLTLEINSIGSSAARATYRERLVEYFSRYPNDLDDDSKRRLDKNPLRILDSKNPALKDIIATAPSISEALDDESRAHFAELQTLLTDLGIAFKVNSRLVRGLDYYNRTVFEWTTRQLGAQGTVCGGGRYDGLVELFGGKPTSGCGFALGVERLLALWQQQTPTVRPAPQVFVISVDDPSSTAALRLAEGLRAELPALRVLVNCGGGSFKSQFRRADKSGAELALILGPDERQAGTVSVKYLREERPQTALARADLGAYLRDALPQ
jgi:histidyl-tRNA synthetase